MKTILRISVIGLLSILPSIAFCWGDMGHRITGGIAECYLSKKAKRNIRAILGNESLAMASTWADFIKSDPEYKYLDTWHYVNVSKGLDYEGMIQELNNDTAANAYNRIRFLTNALKQGGTDREQQKMYLRLLIHIVGDVHQPMHVSRAEDLGGNRVRLQWFNQSTNLHRLWDSQLLEFQNLSFTEYIQWINFSDKTQRRQWQQQPLTEWLFESYRISAGLYEEVKSPEQNFSYRYSFDHVATMNNQLLKGGIRLAGLLNEIFG